LALSAGRRVIEPAATELYVRDLNRINALRAAYLAADLRPERLGERLGFTPLAYHSRPPFRLAVEKAYPFCRVARDLFVVEENREDYFFGHNAFQRGCKARRQCFVSPPVPVCLLASQYPLKTWCGLSDIVQSSG
jgi:hypothetical protein